MIPIDEIFENVIDYMRDNLPSRLSSLGLDEIDTYLVGPPSDVDEKQLTVYLGEGDHSYMLSAENFMLQVQLPKVLDPVKYRRAVDQALVSYDATEVGADHLNFACTAFYPGEVKDGGMSSFLVYSIILENELDDCRDESNY